MEYWLLHISVMTIKKKLFTIHMELIQSVHSR